MALSSKAKKRLEVAVAHRAVGDEIAAAIDAQAADVAALAMTVSGTYTQTQVQAIADKVDAILAALKAAGLMA